MANILDYVAWRGNMTFQMLPFNEVDNLILSELAYAKMENIVPQVGSYETVTLRQVGEAYKKKGYNQSHLVNNPQPLLEKASVSRRFGDLRLGAFVNKIDIEKATQFAAVTFFLDDDTIFVAFRGTDNTIVGWREDFHLSYSSETLGQNMAVQYLNQIAQQFHPPIRVGGHSKGGNHAIYAAAFCDADVQKRILSVWSNDGPGFHHTIANSEAYINTLDKVRLIIPEFSLVGILLSNKEEKKIVRSNKDALHQHIPYSWEVEGTAFVSAEQQSPYSLFFHKTLTQWLKSLDDRRRERLVNAIFDTLDASGAETWYDFHSNRKASYKAILRAVMEMEPSLRGEVWQATKSLFSVSGDIFKRDNLSKTFAQGTFNKMKREYIRKKHSHH